MKSESRRCSLDIQEIEAKLWQAADKLRNNMDAAEYKHVVLGGLPLGGSSARLLLGTVGAEKRLRGIEEMAEGVALLAFASKFVRSIGHDAPYITRTCTHGCEIIV